MKRLILFLCVIVFLFSSCSDDIVYTKEMTNIEKEEKSVNYNIQSVTDYKYEIYGQPISEDELIHFKYDDDTITSIIEKWGGKTFFEQKNRLDLFELYCMGSALIDCFNSYELKVADIIDENDTYIDIYWKEPYNVIPLYETGYSVTSFYSEFGKVFNDDIIKRLFEKYQTYFEYNGELWTSRATVTSGLLKVKTEYEITKETDEEFGFKTINYCIDYYGEEEYNPNKKDEYQITTYDYLFQKYEDGWKIVECPLVSW